MTSALHPASDRASQDFFKLSSAVHGSRHFVSAFKPPHRMLKKERSKTKQAFVSFRCCHCCAHGLSCHQSAILLKTDVS